MDHHVMDIAYRLLDDDVVDSEGRRCGKVDDIEFSGGPGEPAHITGLVSGPGAWPGRVTPRLRSLAEKVFPDEEAHIPWDEIAEIQAVVELKRPSKELGLGDGDRDSVLEKLPGA